MMEEEHCSGEGGETDFEFDFHGNSHERGIGMITFDVIVFVLRVIGAILGIIFQAYRLYHEIQKNHKDKK